MSSLISALDSALAGYGEDVTLRRQIKGPPNEVNVDVVCRARVDVATTEQIEAGISVTDLNVIISPTQIDGAQWPGGQQPQSGPFKDPRIPVINGVDKMIIRGFERTIAYCDPKIIGGELVRINLRVTG